MIPNLIAMLTHKDVSVKNGPRIFDECLDLPLEHWGFKNMGLSRGEMKALVRAMKEAGKTTFLEVVTIGEAECMRGAQIAVEDAFDYLMGTVFYDSVFQYLQKHTTKYFPFCGRIVGHPSILEGTPDDIAHDGFRLQMKGVDGLDLLAYRHSTSAEEIALKLVDNLKIPVIVAGSVDSWEKINFIKRIQPWGLTIGSAFFEKRFVADRSFRDQLMAVYKYLKNNEVLIVA